MALEVFCYQIFTMYMYVRMCFPLSARRETHVKRETERFTHANKCLLRVYFHFWRRIIVVEREMSRTTKRDTSPLQFAVGDCDGPPTHLLDPARVSTQISSYPSFTNQISSQNQPTTDNRLLHTPPLDQYNHSL